MAFRLPWTSRPNSPLDTKSLADPSSWLLGLFGGAPTAAGIDVTPQTAMRCAAVRRAVQAIAEPIGQIPLHVYSRDGDARKRERDHPTAKVLAQPNGWTSASDFREQMQRDCLLHGNGYAFINRVDEKPQELIRLDPTTVEVAADKNTSEPIYTVTTGARKLAYPADEVLHIKAPSLDGYKGVSIVNDCREAIAVALIMEKHASKLFGNGARPGGVLELPKGFGDKALQNLRASWASAYDGSDNAGKTAFAFEDAKFKAITLTSVDAQFLEMRRYAVDEIARAFGVPPHLLFEMGRATWGNAAELGSTFVTFSLMRWVKSWQGEIKLKLFTPDEQESFYAEFLIDDLLKADIAARATAYSQLIAARVLNPNEARARENMAPYAGGDEFANPHTSTAESA